jgi:hypothetical protein
MQSGGDDTSVIGVNIIDLIGSCDSTEKFGYRHGDLEGGVNKKCTLELDVNAQSILLCSPLTCEACSKLWKGLL